MIILGSTGSIGVNALLIAKKFNLNIEVLCAGRNISKLNNQIKEFNPKIVVVSFKEDIKQIKHNKVYFGIDGIKEAILQSKSNLVLNAIVGFAGVIPTLFAINQGKTVALANKESLVVAGNLIDISKIKIIDSEHFGLWYMLNNRQIEKLIITASGGAFRDHNINDLKNVTVKDALCHPSWSMGSKITIDSATMTNKLFELLEAKWLFGITKLDAIIEKNSIIHSIINYQDGSSVAHIAKPDMKLPIAFAILKEVKQNIIEHIDFTQMKNIQFQNIDPHKYPIWQIKDDLLKNPNMGVVLNGSNEIAVDSFLNGKISFLDISKVTLKVYHKYCGTTYNNLDDIVAINNEIRDYTATLCK